MNTATIVQKLWTTATSCATTALATATMSSSFTYLLFLKMAVPS